MFSHQHYIYLILSTQLLRIIVVLPFERFQWLFSVYDSSNWINSCQNTPARAIKIFVENMSN